MNCTILYCRTNGGFSVFAVSFFLQIFEKIIIEKFGYLKENQYLCHGNERRGGSDQCDAKRVVDAVMFRWFVFQDVFIIDCCFFGDDGIALAQHRMNFCFFPYLVRLQAV